MYHLERNGYQYAVALKMSTPCGTSKKTVKNILCVMKLSFHLPSTFYFFPTAIKMLREKKNISFCRMCSNSKASRLEQKNKVAQVKAQDRSEWMIGKKQEWKLDSELCPSDIMWTSHNHLSMEVLNLDKKWVSGPYWSSWNGPLSNTPLSNTPLSTTPLWKHGSRPATLNEREGVAIVDGTRCVKAVMSDTSHKYTENHKMCWVTELSGHLNGSIVVRGCRTATGKLASWMPI